MTRLYLSAPHMSGLESAYVDEAFRTNWLSTVGPNLVGFEAEFSEKIGRPSVALASGTAALHLALRLCGVERGDEVLCSTLTFVASANPIVYQGATPVFIDSERASWNLDPNLLEHALRTRSKKPKALMLVHIFGQSADLDPIVELCDRYGVHLIEDAAEALGASYKGRPVGAFGAVSGFSFNGNKIITTTGGGMLSARDAAWAERARFWSQQARDPGVGFAHSELGFNYRMSNVLAGIGRGQLQVLEQRVARRREVAFEYQRALEPLGGFELMPQAPWGVHTNWLSCFLVDEGELGCSRDWLIGKLAEQDIESRPVWLPMHRQKLYESCTSIGGEVADDLSRRGICLPSSSSLDTEQVARVVTALTETVKAARQNRARQAS
ncbi:MAG: aminotransferase class I/II-fold pyridoxal phosphate-dependent enzyme [Myxococcales bacterium]